MLLAPNRVRVVLPVVNLYCVRINTDARHELVVMSDVECSAGYVRFMAYMIERRRVQILHLDLVLKYTFTLGLKAHNNIQQLCIRIYLYNLSSILLIQDSAPQDID